MKLWLPLIIRALAVAVLALPFLSAPGIGQELPVLSPGAAETREINGGQSQSYRVTLKPGQFARFTIEQRAINLLLTLASPNDAAEKKVSAAANLSAAGGMELLLFEAKAAGEYVFSVQALSSSAITGAYQLSYKLSEESSDRDRRLQAAMLSLSEITVRAMRGPTAENALEKGAALLPIWRELNEPLYLAHTLQSMGEACRILSRFDKAIEYVEQAQAIFKEQKYPAGESDSHRTLGIAYSLRGDLAGGSTHFEEALRLARTVSDQEKIGSLLSNLGTNRNLLGRWEESSRFLTEALELARRIKSPAVEKTALHNLGEASLKLGQEEKAVEYFNRALILHREVKDIFAEGTTLSSLATAYGYIGEYDLAERSYEQALQIRRAQKDRNGEANTLLSIGSFFRKTGQPRKAIEYLQQALEIVRSVKNRLAEAGVQLDLGNSFLQLSNYEKAIEAQESALAIARDLNNPNFVGLSQLNLGSIYSELGQNEKAIEYYQQSVDAFRATKDAKNLTSALLSLGRSQFDLKKFDLAQSYFEQCLEIENQIADKTLKGRILSNMGLVAISRNEYQKGGDYLQQSLALRRETRDKPGESFVLYNLGRCFHFMKQYDRAKDFYQQALESQIPGLPSDLGANIYEGLAGVEKTLGRTDQAQSFIEKSLQISESLRTEVQREESRLAVTASRRSAYEKYLIYLMEQDRADSGSKNAGRAVEISERMRARALIELLMESRIDLRADADPALIEQERTLSLQLAARAEQLFRSPSASVAARLKRDLSQLETEYERTKVAIRKSNPRYAALIQPQPLSLSELQLLLDDDTIALEYALGEEMSWLWVVSKNSLTAYEMPAEKEINERAKRVYNLLISRTRKRMAESPTQQQRRIARDERELQIASRELSRILLAPVSPELLKNKRLAIIPDGGLHYIPFSILPQPGSSQPLVLSHEIVVLPSLSSLAIQRRELAGRKQAEGVVAVLADPVFGGEDPRLKGAAEIAAPKTTDLAAARILDHFAKETSNKLRRTIPRLPFTRIEADRIVSLAPAGTSLKFTDFQANRAVLGDPRLSGYRYLHIATHGLVDAERPGLSSLVLSMVDEQGKPQDGFLRANEIYNLRLPAELVVLSACQTGLGKEIKSEGMVGLTRGFMYAGAKRVMVSLWNVNDQATSELMTRFYRKLLKEGATPAEALRAAQMEMARHPKWNSPYYWAAFVLQGDWK